MDLVSIRQKFCEISGRYDLVVDVTDWADNGADYFIQQGQDMIERLSAIVPETEGRIWETIAIGSYYLTFQKRTRVIKEVWANNDEERFRLEKISWEDLKEYYSDISSGIENGDPAYYCSAKLREVDATDKDATGTFLNCTLANSKDFRGLLILPPVDEAYDIEVVGNFYQELLEEDVDENFWTIEHPGVLVKAAIYQCQLTYKSKRKLDSLLDSIKDDITEISKDVVEESLEDFEQEMEG